MSVVIYESNVKNTIWLLCELLAMSEEVELMTVYEIGWWNHAINCPVNWSLGSC